MQLSAQQLCVTLAGKQVLHDIDLKIPSGQWTCIIGPNGAGKSTLLHALSGLISPVKGLVAYGHTPIMQWSNKQRAKHIAWLGRLEHAQQELTVFDVVMLGRIPHQGWFAQPNAADRDIVEQSLKTVEAWEWRHRPIQQLSAGEIQRVMLARTLCVQAQCVLLDEPISHLDPPHQLDFVRIVQDLVKSGVTVVTVLHELPIALAARHLIIMQHGHVIHQGQTHERDTHLAIEAVFEKKLQVESIHGHWVTIPKSCGNEPSNAHAHAKQFETLHR